jgi:hypothetical protein
MASISGNWESYSVLITRGDGSPDERVWESRRWLQISDWWADGTKLLLTGTGRDGWNERSDVFLLTLTDRSVVRLTAGGYNRSAVFWPSATRRGRVARSTG